MKFAPFICHIFLHFSLLLFLLSLPATARAIDYEFQVRFAEIQISGLVERPEKGITSEYLYRESRAVYKQYNDELSIESLNAIADRVTAIYRGAGYIFTRAYVPKQRSTNGKVEIRLLRGRLESVDIYDNQRFDSDLISLAFKQMLNEEVVSENIEEGIALTNDIPGLDVFGFYSIGERKGGTRLNIRVREECFGSGALRADNHGADVTGSNRLLVEWEQYNLVGTGDSLRMGVLQAFEPNNSSYGLLDFNTLVANPRVSMGIMLSSYSYALGRGVSDVGLLDLSGDTESVTLTGSYKLHRSAGDTRLLKLAFSMDRSETRSSTFPEFIDEDIRSRDLSIGYYRDQLNRLKQNWTSYSVEIKPGEYTEGAPGEQSDLFWLVSAQFSQGYLLRPFGVARAHQLYVDINSQYSEDVLPPDEQFSLAGAQALRGFEPGLFSADTGITITTEWYFPEVPVSEAVNVMPSLFIDYGYGIQRNNLSGVDDDWVELMNAGIGLNISLVEDLDIVLSIAKPISQKISYSDDNDESEQFFAELTWRFF